MADQALDEALEHLVKGIVDRPENVRVDARYTSRGDVLEVRVHPSDLGRVIGRGGRTASSLRTVVSALAEGERVRVDVIDTDQDNTAEGSEDSADVSAARADESPNLAPGTVA